MATLSIAARSAHTFPFTEKEARRAARLWFSGAPALSLAEWRESRCQAHCAGLPFKHLRGHVFRKAFAREIAAIIAGVSHD